MLFDGGNTRHCRSPAVSRAPLPQTAAVQARSPCDPRNNARSTKPRLRSPADRHRPAVPATQREVTVAGPNSSKVGPATRPRL